MTRHQTGRTLAEVKKLLPGDAYVVRSAAEREYVKHMIWDHCEADLAQSVKIVVVRYHRDLAGLHGLRGRVRIDHGVQERLMWSVFEELLAVAKACNARHPDFVR